MKSSSIISKTGVFTISAIILITGVLTLGFYSICSSHDPGECDSSCGKSGEVGGSNVYINIPIINNHFPTTATISQVHMEVPADPCYGEQYEPEGKGCGYLCRCVAGSETRLKEIKFGDTVAFSTSNSYCVCRDSNAHTGHTFALDTNYSFSNAKILCRLTLDVDTVPTGTDKPYNVIYYYTITGDPNLRSNQLTFTLPSP